MLEKKKFYCFTTREKFHLQATILNLIKMAESSLQGLKTLLEKEKFARYEPFLPFQQCFKRPVLQILKKQRLVLERV